MEELTVAIRKAVGGKKYVSAALAEELLLSPSTVSTYRNRILTKLALDSNAGLVRYAIKHGLME